VAFHCSILKCHFLLVVKACYREHCIFPLPPGRNLFAVQLNNIKLRQALPLNYFLLLKSYLHNRHFRVKVGDDYSELTSILAGVPQGSVLGPLLYLLYTADLPTSPRTLIATFADDTSKLTTDSDPAVASRLLQTDLLDIQHWLK
jgi:hypothetical protein